MVVVPPMVYPVTLFVDCIVRTFNARAAQARGVRVSSWLRTAAQQLELREQGRGVVRSLHEKGLAMDLVGTAAQLGAMRAGWIALGLDAVDEGDHLHLELDGPALRRLGIDFRLAA